VASAKSSFRRALEVHRRALGGLGEVRRRLTEMEAQAAQSPEAVRAQERISGELRRVADGLVQGWLGAPWPVIESSRFPVEKDTAPGRTATIRIGDAAPVPGAGFPVVVPLTGVGHLTIDRDARDPAVAGLLRSLLTRLLASFPAGTLRILAVDGGALGAPLAPFAALVPAGVMNEPVTDVAGLRNVLEEAEEQVRRVQSGEERDPDLLLIACAALPSGCGRTDYSRIAALAHAGPSARVHLVLAGYPPAPDATGREKAPPLELTTRITSRLPATRVSPSQAVTYLVGDAPRDALGAEGRGLNAPVVLDEAPPDGLVEELSRHIAQRAESEGVLNFADLVPERLWQESSVQGLRTVVGRAGRGDAVLSLDDATPHWLVGGRTGSGKTVFLLDVLYGLAARYSPDELALYLLDFKEGVSFTEFIPTDADPSWVPHARTVGVESDRQYGVSVLTELVREMNRRAGVMKQSGVTKLSDLRGARRDVAMPRLVTVIDEFHVLFQGNDETAKRAAALLEEVSRKGRSYGVHLILASQSVSGIEALYTKGQSVFGQFGMRVALSGGGGVLSTGNTASDALPLGQAIVNDAAGVPAGNLRIRFPYADAESLTRLRHRIWERRIPGSTPPGVFVGYAEYAIDDDPTFRRLAPGARRRSALLGRAVDVGLPAAGFVLDSTPGRHLAVLGTSSVGADLLHAAALSLGQQHEPGSATFLLVDLVAAAEDVVEETARALQEAGHAADILDLDGYRDSVARLAKQLEADEKPSPTFLLVFGADVATSALKRPYQGTKRSGMDDFRLLLRDGPTRRVHVLGWWRGLRRLTDDLGPGGKEDVAGIVALNIRGSELGPFLGHFNMEYAPRANRALFVDRHEDAVKLIVPFVRPGRYASESV
jgi:S-DNA-T family DNA segregation ATPase FtsK/SpoIIIE